MEQKAQVVGLLNQVLEMELAGMVRYIHYSFMIFGHARQPVISWFQNEAQTALIHAHKAGEILTDLGEHPSLQIGPLLETHQHSIQDILEETMEWEQAGLHLYEALLEQVAGHHWVLEKYARAAIVEESAHIAELDKMMRSPGDILSIV